MWWAGPRIATVDPLEVLQDVLRSNSVDVQV